MNLIKAVLNKVSQEAYSMKKISTEEYKNLVEYAEHVADKNYIELDFDSFDQANSQGMIFSAMQRTATAKDSSNPVYVGDISEEVLVNNSGIITLSHKKITSLEVYNHDRSVKYAFSTDYTIDAVNGVVMSVGSGSIVNGTVVYCSYTSLEQYGTDTSFVQTIGVKIGDSTIKAIKVDADKEDVSIQISKNNLDFYSISSYNSLITSINEDSLSFRVATSAPNKIRKIMVIFDKNLV